MVNSDEAKDVLIVDDDEGVVDVLEMYCQDLGYFRSIIKAFDGQQAASKLSNQNFRLILMDVNMPKRSGVELVGEFDRFKLNRLSDVMIISGGFNQKMVEQTVKYGVKNFLVKPFDEDIFKKKVESILANKNKNKNKKG
jgi:two-component system chemotaxis response regulator CheY